MIFMFCFVLLLLFFFLNKNDRLVAIYPKQLIFFFGSSLHAVIKCGAVHRPEELS